MKRKRQENKRYYKDNKKRHLQTLYGYGNKRSEIKILKMRSDVVNDIKP